MPISRINNLKSMKIFQENQKNWALGGFERNQTAFNSTVQWHNFLSIWFIIAILVYAIEIANTPRQYMDSMSMLIISILVLISRISAVLRMADLFDIIDDIEHIIGESEF